MKRCGKCRRRYTDDTLNFCLEDELFFRNVEIVATRTKFGRDRLKFLAKRLEKLKQKRAERKAS